MGRFSIEDKMSAVKRHLENGESCKRIAGSIGADDVTVREWCRNYQVMGIDAFTRTHHGKYTLEFKTKEGERGIPLVLTIGFHDWKPFFFDVVHDFIVFIVAAFLAKIEGNGDISFFS